MLGMADPASCTLNPLSTPLLEVLTAAPPCPLFTALAPASTLKEAEEGPDEILVETLRSNWPAAARCRSANASCGA